MLYIKINSTKYELISFEENIDELNKDEFIEAEKPQVLYLYMDFRYDGDIIRIRREICDFLNENNHRFTIYKDNGILNTYEGVYFRFVKRFFNLNGTCDTVSACFKIYLET